MNAPSADTPVLAIKGLVLRFGGVAAINNVSLDVRQGEILGIVGPNGAGKTALINTITGFYRAQSGSIHFLGRMISDLSKHRICRLGIARTFQNIRLFRQMSVLENVLTAVPAYTRAPFRSVFAMRQLRRDKTCALDLLAAVGMAAKADALAGSLSYGEARRVEIARAMATSPRLLLLDEPAAGMNERESATLVEEIDKLRSALSAIVLIEHDMSVVRSLASRLIAMDAGQKIAEGDPTVVLSDPLVVNAYLGEAEVPTPAAPVRLADA